MGGCGVTTESFHITPILSGLDGDILRVEFQGIGMSAGSTSQGCESMTVFMNSFKPDKLVLMDPMTAEIGSAPAMVEHHPSVGIRKAVGLNPNIPQLAAGLLILPMCVLLSNGWPEVKMKEGDLTTNITPNSQTTPSHRNQRSLPSATPSRSQIPVIRIDSNTI